MDDDDAEGENEPAYLACYALIACHSLWYNNTNVDAGFSLGRVLVHIRPDEGNGFPIRVPRLFVYTEMYGTSGEYILRIRLVRIELTEDGEEVETDDRWKGLWEVTLPDENFVECFGFAVPNVYLPEEGVYEFQLWADGFDEPLGARRFRARL